MKHRCNDLLFYCPCTIDRARRRLDLGIAVSLIAATVVCVVLLIALVWGS